MSCVLDIQRKTGILVIFVCIACSIHVKADAILTGSLSRPQPRVEYWTKLRDSLCGPQCRADYKAQFGTGNEAGSSPLDGEYPMQSGSVVVEYGGEPEGVSYENLLYPLQDPATLDSLPEDPQDAYSSSMEPWMSPYSRQLVKRTRKMLQHKLENQDLNHTGKKPHLATKEKRKVPNLSMGMPIRLMADYMREYREREKYNEQYFKALSTLADIGK